MFTPLPEPGARGPTLDPAPPRQPDAPGYPVDPMGDAEDRSE